MATTVVGLFDSEDNARLAIQDLMKEGYPQQEMSLISSDPEGEYRRYKVDEEGNQAGEGAVAGAAGGAVAGGLFGLLVGTGALAFPAIGLVAAGPIAGLLGGAGIGAISGGIVGALVGWGIPEEHAHAYAEAVRRGSVLLTLKAEDDRVDRAEEIMSRHHAVDIEERAAHFRDGGFERFDGGSRPLSKEETQRERELYHSSALGAQEKRGGRARSYRKAPSSHPIGGIRDAGTGERDWKDEDEAFRRDYETRYQGNGMKYEQCAPAYRYGFHFAAEAGQTDWERAEGSIRERWEEYNPGTWEQYREAVRVGYERGSRVQQRQRGGPEML
jgi:uncharacterized membrane protein